MGFPLGFLIGPLTPFMRAQNDRLRGPPPGCGALRCEPVMLLYRSLPFFVSPPVLDFSPRRTERLTLWRFFPARVLRIFLRAGMAVDI